MKLEVELSDAVILSTIRKTIEASFGDGGYSDTGEGKRLVREAVKAALAACDFSGQINKAVEHQSPLVVSEIVQEELRKEIRRVVKDMRASGELRVSIVEAPNA